MASSGENILEGMLLSEYEDGSSDIALATDLYELTMAAAYYYSNETRKDTREKNGIFEMFVRKLPRKRAYLVVAGIEQALYFL
ncbi:MAG: hypothetical protein ACM3JQ_01445, partial [Candidatus Eiseniibacteriota bacterium]